MNISIYCIPCLVKQTIEAMNYVSVDLSVHEGVLREMLCSLAGLDFNQSPPVVGQWIHRRLRELTGNNDKGLWQKMFER
jgi:damage-control phosphatase, subfamily I